MKSLKTILLLFSISFVFTACWDRVEIEDRSFVISVGIDKYNDERDHKIPTMQSSQNINRYTISMALPNIQSITSENSGSDSESNSIIKNAANETIYGAIEVIDSYSSSKLYLGHTKLVVFSAEILKDKKLLKEALDALERNTEINRKVYVVASEEPAQKILEAKSDEDHMVAIFVNKFYSSNSNSHAMSFKLDLASLLLKLSSNNGDIIIPKIKLVDEHIKLSGSAIIRNYELVGWLNDVQTIGYLWVKGKADSTILMAPYDETYTSLKIDNNKTKISFREIDKRLVATVDVNVKGSIEEFSHNNKPLTVPENIDELSSVYEQIIKEQINNTWYHFCDEFIIDGFEFKDLLRKKNYNLYLNYKDNWDEALYNMQLVTNVRVQITSTGSTK